MINSQQYISRQYAIEHNLPRYFTGKPCIHGHIAERYTKKTNCTECERIKKQKVRAKRKKLLGAGGKNTYSTGKPCIHGHKSERFVSNGQCVECKRIQREKEKIKARPLREKQKKLRKEAADKKKKERQQKFQESKLNKKEKEVRDYARKCIRQMYQKPSKYGQSYLLPQELIELENGYTQRELNDYLARLRPSWLTKRKWHVDHIIPLSKLVKKGVTEVYILNSLDNLQLLTPAANMKKSDKLVMPEDAVDEFIFNKLRDKWASEGYIEPLGLYNPSERIKKIVKSEAERIYVSLFLSLKRTKFQMKASKKTVIRAIIKDMWNDNSYVYNQPNGPTEADLMNFYERSGGHYSEGVMYLLYEGYPPLKKIISNSKKYSDFKYKEDARSYFEGKIRTCDAVARRYFVEQILKTGELKEKGFFRRHF
tara:strand:- start:65 stop:1339 length:1275 start_codon:yes stop_codon:yes gene_type:complete